MRASITMGPSASRTRSRDRKRRRDHSTQTSERSLSSSAGFEEGFVMPFHVQFRPSNNLVSTEEGRADSKEWKNRERGEYPAIMNDHNNHAN